MTERKRVKMELQEKLKIIHLVEVEKRRVSHVARMYNRNESSIRQIMRVKDKIKANAPLYPNHVQVSNCPRKKLMLKVENEIYKWLDELKKDEIPINPNLVSQRALEIYDDLAKSIDELQTDGSKLFMASKNWVTSCLNRYEMKKCQDTLNPISIEEPAAEATDVENVETSMPMSNPLLADLERTIKKENFVPKQIFCVHEIGLFWKRLPERCAANTYIEELLDCKYNKDKMSLIMCGNAAGHFIKPGVIYRKSNPSALQKKQKNSLPVFWMSNKKMRVTATLFLEWFHQCFKPAVKSYLEAEQLDFKILLLVNKAPWHPGSLVTEDEHIKIFYLPSPFNLELQPMQQGILKTYKINYFMEVFQMLKNAHQNGGNVLKTWSEFSLIEALTFLRRALDNLDTKCFIACWQRLPLAHKNRCPTKKTKKHDMLNLIKMAHKIPVTGLNDIQMPELKLFLEQQEELVDSKDLEKLNSSRSPCIKEELSESDVPSWKMEDFNSILELANKLKQQITRCDPSLERSISINQEITNALKPVEYLYTELKRQHEQAENAAKKRKYEDKPKNSESFEHEHEFEIVNVKIDEAEEDYLL